MVGTCLELRYITRVRPMRTIKLTKNKEAIVDDTDYDFLNQFSWYFTTDTGYAKKKSPKVIGMHQLLMNPSIGMEVDHINRNKLDNRRCNLRICTVSQNRANRPLSRRSTTGYKGVSRHNFGNKHWRAKITVGKRQIHVGVFV